MSDNNRLKNFLVNGFQALDPREQAEEPVTDEETFEEDIAEAEETTAPAEEPQPEPAPVAQPAVDAEALKGIETELIRIRYMLEDLSARPAPEAPDMGAYLTTREQAKSLTAAIGALESVSSNKQLLRAMEQVSVMREDFSKLCKGMRARIGEMDAETVLSSFEAYEVDMENILSDGGVYVGRFDFDRLNTLHQRIVGVVPTDEKEKDGTIAERQSDGYKLGEKVLLKERVTVYKYTPAADAGDSPEVETASETPSETDSKQLEDPNGEPAPADGAAKEDKE
ncbi:MAG: hypothetical protein Q4Q62_05415 [Thermoplasmata archaeon]|nr:hypothetical protein [Thermoplasmata archaeon]